MRSRDGFTLTELLIVLVLLSIIGGITVAQVGRMLGQTRVQRAASVVAADMKMAHALAGRARRPVRISIDSANRVIRVRDFSTPTTVYSERHFHAAGEYPVQTFIVSDTSLLVYPNGLAAGALSVTVGTTSGSRQVTMTRAGQVRVIQP